MALAGKLERISLLKQSAAVRSKNHFAPVAHLQLSFIPTEYKG